MRAQSMDVRGLWEGLGRTPEDDVMLLFFVCLFFAVGLAMAIRSAAMLGETAVDGPVVQLVGFLCGLISSGVFFRLAVLLWEMR